MRRFAMPRPAAQRHRNQRGQTAIIFVFLMPFLILVLGMVIDSARLYILSAQAERAAEAGALAGALYMPSYYNTPSPDGNDAVSRVCAAVKQNGITNCPAVMGTDGAVPSTVPGNPYEVQVTVTLTADVFFLDYLIPGLSTATISRSAIGQYLPPIQLGSRSTYFGDQADTSEGQPLQYFWARINGPYELQENGDAYTPLWQEGPSDPIAHPDGGSFAFNRWTPAVCCTNHQQWPNPIPNPDQQPTGFTDANGTPGYNYEIVVPPDVGNVQVQIYNPAFDPPNSATQDDIGSACLDPTFNNGGCQTDQQNEYLQMHYTLYSAPLPFERTADSLLASYSPPSLDLYPGDLSRHDCNGADKAWDPEAQQCVDRPRYVNDWHTFFTITNPGTYRLVVAATGYYGEHGYGIKLTDTFGNPAPEGTRIWAWNNMCVYFSTTGATSLFDLGEIPAAYAGKTLDFSLFDPGDSTGDVYMEILDPSGNPVQLPSWLRTVTGSGGTELDASTAGDRIYNGLWLHMPIAIPSTYNPAPGSDWWQVEYLTPNGTPTDTVTISISLSGSPVHLVTEVF